MMMKDMVLLHHTRDLDGIEDIGGAYGPHFMMDLSGCDPKTFNRKSIKKFMKKLCKVIKMDAEDFHFWDDEDVPEDKKQTEAHAVGTSIGGVFKKKVGVQFIITSSIVIHTIDLLERAYVDIFSCKLFDDGDARSFTQEWFKADMVGTHLIQRH